jgi:hypothetical protein
MMLVANIIGLKSLGLINYFGHSLFLWVVENHLEMVFTGLQIKRKKNDFHKLVLEQIEELHFHHLRLKIIQHLVMLQIIIDQVS